MGRESRRRTRRTNARPAAPALGMQGGTAEAPTPVSRTRAAGDEPPIQVRSDRLLAREAVTMITELKRVGIVSAVCFGMLAVLVVVDRLQ